MKAAILSACFGRAAQTIGSIDHCCDNYLPDMLTWFDFPDISGAHLAQKILVVMGETDPAFPRASVLEAETIVREILAAQKKGRGFDLIFGRGGHRFYADLAWPRFEALLRG